MTQDSTTTIAASRGSGQRMVGVVVATLLVVTSTTVVGASAEDAHAGVSTLGDPALEVALVADIVPGTASSNPLELTAFGGKLYFHAPEPVMGTDRPMWVSDGTAAGTTIVTSVGAGRPDRPEDLTVVDGRLFFSARTLGTEETPTRDLWVRDGATGATRRVEPQLRPAFSSGERELAAFGGRLHLIANDGSGVALWVSDGSQEGTTPAPYGGVEQLTFLPGAFGAAPALTVAGRDLFFVARQQLPDAGLSDPRLWAITEGDAGTKQLDDLTPPDPILAPTNPQDLTAVGELLYFTAEDPVRGRELWVSDGTAEGTMWLRDILPGDGGSDPQELTALGRRLLFTADDGVNGRELWVSQGSTDSTGLVKDINPGTEGSFASQLTAVGDRVFFVAYDGSSDGSQLWVSDGTSDGTVLVKDFGGFSHDPLRLVAFGERLFFTAGDDRTGRELWVSDGTAQGTALVRELREGPDGSSPDYLTVVDDRLFFTARTEAAGTELWVLRPRATGGSGSVPGAGGSGSVPGTGGDPAPDQDPVTEPPIGLFCDPADAASFLDVAAESTHGPAIGCLGGRGILTGFADQTFRPSLTITRAQAASVTFRAMNDVGAELVAQAPTFDDVRGPHAGAIGALADVGVLTGFADGSFRPGDPVTRGQLASMIARASQALGRPLPAGTASFADVPIGGTHADAIGALVGANVVRGHPDGSFRPAVHVTRAQTATMLRNWLGGLDA